MSSRKSSTCFRSGSPQPRMEYDSEQEAHASAARARCGGDGCLVPYLCDRCGLWHLTPAARHTPSKPCPHCCGRDGRPKDTYTCEEDARRRAEILRTEQNRVLRAYPCPYGRGWHLTKRVAQ